MADIERSPKLLDWQTLASTLETIDLRMAKTWKGLPKATSHACQRSDGGS